MNRKAMFGVLTALAVGSGTAYMIGSKSNQNSIGGNTPIPDSTQVDPAPSPTRTNTFLVISDAHLHKGFNQQQVGQGTPDTGEDLWKIARERFTKMANGTAGYPKPDFVVLLGDLPWHANPAEDSQLVVARQSTGTVLTDLRDIAQKADLPLVYSPGNNDSWSGDYRAFTAPNGQIPFDQDTGAAKDWPVINSGACGLKSAQACVANRTQEKLGCYSVYPLGEKGGLRIIVLNTVMFASDQNSPEDWHYYGPQGTQQSDVNAQMKWFEQQFSEGDPNDAIIIAVHIPPGLNGYGGSSMWNPALTYQGQSVLDAFLEITGKNEKRIVGMLTSHTHMDGLRKLMHKGKTGVEFTDLVVSIPGITPGFGNNPGMKLMHYEPGTFEWLDFTTVYNDYWSANTTSSGQKNPTVTVASAWGNKSYTFSNVFGSKPNITMRDWVAQMDSTAFYHGVDSIYTAFSTQSGGHDINLTLEVRPGQ